MPENDWHSVLDTSLNGFYHVTQALLQPMLVHKYGRIINLASVSGLKGLSGQTNYSAAKGGIIAATKALAQEVARICRSSRLYRDGHDGRSGCGSSQEDDSYPAFWQT